MYRQYHYTEWNEFVKILFGITFWFTWISGWTDDKTMFRIMYPIYCVILVLIIIISLSARKLK